ncbi:uncharacterized protein V6R79_013288 [Siganus canaliculatus]
MAGVSGFVWMAVLLIAITVMLHSAQEVFGISGKELEEKIIDKCNRYKTRTDPQKDPKHASVDCEAFLKRFKSAFVGKNPNEVTPDSYKDLMETFKLPTHKDKYLFWCKTANLLGRLISNQNNYFYHIQDTVFGFLDITGKWCGKEGSEEIIMTGCPENPSISYWQAASKTFAQAATGDVTVFLSDKNFYVSHSYFGNDELPNLNSNTVTELRVLLVLEEQRNVGCGHGSLKNLKKEAGPLGEKYSCRHILEAKIKRYRPEGWWNNATLICRMAGGSGSVRMAVLLVAITVMLHSAQEVFGNGGKEVEAMITKNCNDYKSKKDPQKDPNHARIDCKAFLNKFKSAFVNKDPKTITPESYNPLKETFKLPAHQDRYLFWSGPAALVGTMMEKNNNHFYNIHDTVFGFLRGVDDFCGQKGSNEIITRGCPDEPFKSYWKAASRAFAEAATGKVMVLLNDDMFYDNTRYFATDELPYFNRNTVTQLQVLIVITNVQTTGYELKRIGPNEWWDKARNVVLHKEKHKMQPSADPEEQVHQV